MKAGINGIFRFDLNDPLEPDGFGRNRCGIGLS
jgi:hypothetical protein